MGHLLTAQSVHFLLCGTESWPLVIQTKAAKRRSGHFSICGVHFISRCPGHPPGVLRKMCLRVCKECDIPKIRGYRWWLWVAFLNGRRASGGERGKSAGAQRVPPVSRRLAFLVATLSPEACWCSRDTYHSRPATEEMRLSQCLTSLRSLLKLALSPSFLGLLADLSPRACSGPALHHGPLPHSPAVGSVSLGGEGGGQLHQAVVPKPVSQHRTRNPAVTMLAQALAHPKCPAVPISPGRDCWHHLRFSPWKPR